MSTAGQRVALGGHWVSKAGQTVMAFGQRVWAGGQIVSATGHFVSAGGQRVTTTGQRVGVPGSAVTRGVGPLVVIASAKSAKKRSKGLATAVSTGTVSSAAGMRTRKNLNASEEATRKGLEAFQRSCHGPDGPSPTWRMPSPFHSMATLAPAEPDTLTVGE